MMKLLRFSHPLLQAHLHLFLHFLLLLQLRFQIVAHVSILGPPTLSALCLLGLRFPHHHLHFLQLGFVLLPFFFILFLLIALNGGQELAGHDHRAESEATTHLGQCPIQFL